MEIFPAVDILGGAAVRLVKGDYNKVSVYSPDPVAVALGMRETGAINLHLVDLDGAREGSPVNLSIIRRIIKESGLFTEVGGGIRTEERIERYLELGAGRVILGTAAVRDFDFIKRVLKKYGDRAAVGVDAKGGRVAVAGWQEVTDIAADEFLLRLAEAGAQHVIYTDIDRDGMLNGINTDVYKKLVKIGGVKITASGGITYLDEIIKLKEGGVYGAILGKALYEGRLNLADALRLAKEEK